MDSFDRNQMIIGLLGSRLHDPAEMMLYSFLYLSIRSFAFQNEINSVLLLSGA